MAVPIIGLTLTMMRMTMPRRSASIVRKKRSGARNRVDMEVMILMMTNQSATQVVMVVKSMAPGSQSTGDRKFQTMAQGNLSMAVKNHLGTVVKNNLDMVDKNKLGTVKNNMDMIDKNKLDTVKNNLDMIDKNKLGTVVKNNLDMGDKNKLDMVAKNELSMVNKNRLDMVAKNKLRTVVKNQLALVAANPNTVVRSPLAMAQVGLNSDLNMDRNTIAVVVITEATVVMMMNTKLMNMVSADVVEVMSMVEDIDFLDGNAGMIDELLRLLRLFLLDISPMFPKMKRSSNIMIMLK
jgi:hypothetical protein